MRNRTAEIVRLLSERAEDACRYYLSNGRKVGGYWIVGDRRNAKGKSLYLRLIKRGDNAGAAGKWTDGATGEHGDLLDIIATAIGSDQHAHALAEAERFLGLPCTRSQIEQAPRDCAVSRLLAASEPIAGTLAERYLKSRSITDVSSLGALRFHPRCYCRAPNGQRRTLPAMLAAVTDDRGAVTGLMRTYLAHDGSGKAAIEAPRRAMGALAGNGVRFGPNAEVMLAGEGIETVLSLRMAMPAMPMIAALSAAHLGALIPPSQLRRFYIAIDRDDAGRNAARRLATRLDALSIETATLSPRRNDFNDDLIANGPGMLAARVAEQLTADDRQRFMSERGRKRR